MDFSYCPPVHNVGLVVTVTNRSLKVPVCMALIVTGKRFPAASSSSLVLAAASHGMRVQAQGDGS
jgi:hypothetical protein